MLVTGFSIVLCTFNGSGRLRETLFHLAALFIPVEVSIEIILVDNASTDGTAEFAKNVWEELGGAFPLQILRESRAGKGYAVETGYDAAIFSHILTVDDDNWLDSKYLLNAAALFANHHDIGVLQGHSEGVFESPPPAWIEQYYQYFIIGSPIKKTGYFPANNFFVWGAGMIIKREDWQHLRAFGFAFLTSKLPGKAAGEDNELALALLILGRKIYYSDQLRYQHFMPTDRIKWNRLRSNFETFGYVSHYFFLYALVIDAYEKKYTITNLTLIEKLSQLKPTLSNFSWKQHVCYLLKPMVEWYQLELTRHYSRYKWFVKLRSSSKRDIMIIQSWMIPLLNRYPSNFTWPTRMF